MNFLNKEELDILSSYENDEFESDLTQERLDLLHSSAKKFAKKDQKINIHLSTFDLKAFQTKALEEGLSYQDLISSVLHKYISGSLEEVRP